MALVPIECPASTHLVGVRVVAGQLSLFPPPSLPFSPAAVSEPFVGTISPTLSQPSVAAEKKATNTSSLFPSSGAANRAGLEQLNIVPEKQ